MTIPHTILRYNRIPFHNAAGEEILQRVEAHWEDMRSTHALPSRATLSPEPLEQALSHCFVLERVAPEVARFRVAGRDLTELLGMEAQSMLLSALFTVKGKQTLGALIENVVDGPHIVEVPLVSARGFGRASAKGRLLMLPLADRNGAPSRIFGAVVTDAPAGRPAGRFDIDDSVPLRCKRVFAADQDRVVRAPRPITGRAAVTPLHPQAANTAPRKPHLRLVVDNTATPEMA